MIRRIIVLLLVGEHVDTGAKEADDFRIAWDDQVYLMIA